MRFGMMDVSSLPSDFSHLRTFVKIESEGEKRAFTIRYEGFLKNKMVMRNEYGIRIGHVTTENKDNLIHIQ